MIGAYHKDQLSEGGAKLSEYLVLVLSEYFRSPAGSRIGVAPSLKCKQKYCGMAIFQIELYCELYYMQMHDKM